MENINCNYGNILFEFGEICIVFKIGRKHWNYTLHFFLTCWGTKYSDAPAWIIYWGEMEEFIFISPHLYCEGNEINSSISSQLMGGKWKSLISFPPTSCRGNGELIFISSHLYCEEMKSKSSFPLLEVGGNESKLFHLPPTSWEEMEVLVMFHFPHSRGVWKNILCRWCRCEWYND